MPKKKIKPSREKIGHIIPGDPIPAKELEKYRVDTDPHSEGDIADYVHGQARDETVQHIEKIKEEIVLGEKYEVWDVITDKDRWWVITNHTNLYSQRHFRSLDYTLSFHLGLMLRIRSKPNTADSSEPSPFDDTLVGHFIHILERERTDNVDECPLCKSRNIRTHFDISIEQDGDYYMTCGVCDWSSHP